MPCTDPLHCLTCRRMVDAEAFVDLCEGDLRSPGTGGLAFDPSSGRGARVSEVRVDWFPGTCYIVVQGGVL